MKAPLLATALLLPALVAADGESQSNKYFVMVGGFWPDVDTSVRIDGNGGRIGTQLDFESDVSVSSIGLIPGYDKIDPTDGTDRFAQNRVVKVARFEFSDGSSVRAGFEQLRDMQFVAFEQPIRTNWIRIVVEQTYPLPEGGRDFTPISEVQVLGAP